MKWILQAYNACIGSNIYKLSFGKYSFLKGKILEVQQHITILIKIAH